MRTRVPGIEECPRARAKRERRRAIEALAGAYRRELELAERFARIGEGETIDVDEVNAAIDARQFAEAQLGEWS